MNETAKRILDLAEVLWLERGFNGFSYQHLAKPMGLKNAAIHYHYPGKADLGVALVARFRRRFQRSAAHYAATSNDPWDKLEAYVELLTVSYADSERLCPTGMLAAEWATLPEPVREEARGFMRELYAWCAGVLHEGVTSGHFRFAGSCEDKAALLLATLQGGLQVARFEPNWLDAIKKQLRLDLGAR
ncbi:TetR/AcrR family transcriptional regulator [Chitinimonas sp. BJB300]|uniref:TetR/AcrR family transcriptional regulator n=1 Tax=Chitinimonas sp. BJB300 TaxID=1559339 RepID=UPI000C10CAF4|nr:TetR/AcrR family transcriptional regulator [Chitinimonas sp. BJB300]PHV12371.1 TetR family transcriptional regulator [Chitinimonas sp. BJB300]TSJ91081.1 TetR/AcrR family transcriptional regulator [Chitinimonas sp. BJB300]